MSWVSIGAQSAIAHGDLYYPKKPVTTTGCKNFNGSDILIDTTIDTLR